MKLTELIGRLVEIEEVHGGDMEVRIPDENENYEIKYVSREGDHYYIVKDGVTTYHEKHIVLIQ